MKEEVLEQIRDGLIVSCQALKDEPLYSSYIMSRMAFAAKEGGAVGIRANTPQDISEIKKTVDLPVIGLYKAEYNLSDANVTSDDLKCRLSEVYITPTEKEIDALIEVKPEIIALDATNRVRPNGMTIEKFFPIIRKKYPNQLFMADCSCYEDGVRAEKLGFDLVGTTLTGYTKETAGIEIPSFSLISRLSHELHIPLIAEGGIWEPSQLCQVFSSGAYAAVIGTAITRPRDITRRFVSALPH